MSLYLNDSAEKTQDIESVIPARPESFCISMNQKNDSRQAGMTNVTKIQGDKN